MLRLTRLTLTNFRSYPALTWRPAARLAVVSGPNGSGKTNLLEAISLLVPGRGLRNARIAELGRRSADGPHPWGVVGRFNQAGIETEIATGSPPEGPLDKRVFRLDGTPARSQADIAGAAAAIWLTPQMDRLFGDAASGRRRFLDRLVWALEPGHAREVAAYETAMASRNRLLATEADPAWLAGLEDSMARHAVAVSVARAGLVARLNGALASGVAAPFPVGRMLLQDPLAEQLARDPALAVEDWLRTRLAESRAQDAAGSTQYGAHRADMTLADAATGLEAALSSTGQQKALLIGVILGHAALIASARGHAPLLLLDEPAVHLDAWRRAALWQALAASEAQAVLTGTDPDAFAGLRGTAEFLRAGEGALRTL
ncbi:MAG: DNA replication/repair protein RecF [Acetobacteraceae bacterium]|nr:DNA replication/repair protein RecF [Acetobacteraceae bacterium]